MVRQTDSICIPVLAWLISDCRLTCFKISCVPAGRPVDVLMLPDGSVLVTDDKVGAVYQITYSTAAAGNTTAAAASNTSTTTNAAGR